MAIVQISVVPLGVEGTSLSAYVAQAIRPLKESSLEYELTAMGVIVSGDLDEIWKVVRKMHESCFDSGVKRVLTSVKIDDRRDKLGTPEQKVQSVLRKLSEETK